MKPYRIDFVNGRGHEMTLDKDGGIRRSELDELEINMLRSQNVPCLLPLEWMEMDGNLTFRYALNGKKMLIHRLQQQPLAMEQFYGLLHKVVSGLLECRDYMLRPEGCMLGDTFLFVGENIEDVSFVYVPLHARKEESAAGDDLLAMVARWSAYIEHVDGEGLQEVLRMFGGNRWPLEELRELMLEKLGSKHLLPEAASGNDGITSIFERGVPERADSMHRQGLGYSSITTNESIESFDQGDESFIDSGEASAKKSGSRRWLIASGGVLGTACIWRFVYLGYSTTQTMLVSLGLTVLLLAAVVWMWRRGAGMLLEPSAPVPEGEDMAVSFELHSGPLRRGERWRTDDSPRESWSMQDESDRKDGVTTSSLGSYALPPKVKEAEAEQRKMDDLHAPTTVLGGKDADQANDGGGHVAADVLLRRRWNGKEEVIPISSDVFRIGRGCGGDGYEEKADGVSRLHLEIVKEQGCHVAKDLGSRNGSLLNGTMMVPYKSYPIAVGDTIQLTGNKGPAYQFGKG
ncbi:DUF6382 domain-containing protein [Paenibacillus sp. PAMC21692]|uniref:DUF6382 domain-containing protein n=1 Tax=Paenibacillus sp. PAMC21692 TaxID=2762320 RepID=UPI00164E527C|nr:DUF6382 domain-containing protein [Paenibacillus sp. PAMC21692]QNK59704.1 FHA domain-containing protein [Paenibacillus sp. PAMC21692]